MARGERPGTERTSEDREHARAERERRRAERAGLPVPAEPPPIESDPDAEGAPIAAPEPEPAETELDAIGPIAPPEPADPPELPPEPVNAPPFLEAEPGHAPIDPPEAMDPPPVEVEPESVPAMPEDAGAAAGLDHVAPGPKDVAPEPEHVAPEEEHVAPEPEHVALDPEHAPLDPEPAAIAPDPDLEAGAPAPEPEAVIPDPAPEHAPPDPEPAWAISDQEPEHLAPAVEGAALGQELHAGEPDAPEQPAEAAADPHADAGPPAEDAPGYPIPGLPDGPEPAPREPLPEPPPRLRGSDPTPMRRAFRREGSAAGGVGAVALASDGRTGRRSRDRSRWIAVIALLVIGAVVALLVYGLSRSSHHTTAKAPPEVKVLIPEGKTRLQIAQIASAAGLKGSYRVAARSSPLLNPTQYGAPHGTSTLEGFLFPATYDMNKGAPSARLVEEQLQAFQENFTSEYAKRARELGLTPYELLTVASMIEREAQVPSDRAKIAAVIYNRLKAGIPLGIDATIYYAVENAHNSPTYTKELTTSQLETDSAYNTRLHKGLPPTPISNPGVASIQAAAHPAHASYTYYVAGADGCGEQRFSTTEEKFNEDVAAYEAAKRANGGHLPACKKH